MNPTHLTPAQKMTRARNRLLITQPFFGVLALKLQLVEDTSQPTAWVNGVQMGYNPDWINELENAEVQGLVAHEVMHCVHKHVTRRNNRKPGKWNDAADYVINGGLLETGFKLPEGGLVDSQYDGMSTDHVYNLLPDKPEDEPSCEWGEAKDGPDQSTSEKAALDQEWTIATRQAVTVAKQQGSMPGNLEQLIEGLLEPKVPWKEVLRNFMTQPKKNDYTMTRPNRRFINDDLYLPSMYSEGLGTVVITVDTSGSISTKELQEFQSEINCILEDTQPEKVYILYCDTDVHKDIDEFTSDDLPVELVMRGGGGTDFTAPYTWLEDQDLVPDCFIYFTDLYGDCSANEPPCPVLWLSTTSKSDVPFGEVIHMS